MPHSPRKLHSALNGMLLVDFVGAARSRPPGNGPERSVEWHHVRDRTNSPNLVCCNGIVPRGRLRASPTVLSWCCANSPNSVHHFLLVLRWRLVAAPTMASLQIPICLSGVSSRSCWNIQTQRRIYMNSDDFFRFSPGGLHSPSFCAILQEMNIVYNIQSSNQRSDGHACH